MQDKYPVTIWTTEETKEIVYSITSSTTGFDGPHLIDDMLSNQWTPQRNGWAYDQYGYAYWVHVGYSNLDIEIWKNGAGSWTIDSGSWTCIVSSTIGDYTAVDVESRKDWLWIGALSSTTIQPYYHVCDDDTLTGTEYTGPSSVVDKDYDFVLTKLLAGDLHYCYNSGTASVYCQQSLIGGLTDIQVTAQSSGSQSIICYNSNRLWVFMGGTSDIKSFVKDADCPFENRTENTTSLNNDSLANYNVCHRVQDDTIHMALVEYDIGSERSYGTEYDIVAVDTGAETFSITGDHTAEFTDSVTFEVNNSTGNDGDWVVQDASVYLDPNTIIKVTGDITDATVDGKIKAYTVDVTNTFRLKYFRRNSNGWTTVQLDTWGPLGATSGAAQLSTITPQITSSPDGIIVYSLEVQDSGNPYLNYYFLDVDGYSTPITSGSWSSGSVDTGTSNWAGINAPESWKV